MINAEHAVVFLFRIGHQLLCFVLTADWDYDKGNLSGKMQLLKKQMQRHRRCIRELPELPWLSLLRWRRKSDLNHQKLCR